MRCINVDFHNQCLTARSKPATRSGSFDANDIPNASNEDSLDLELSELNTHENSSSSRAAFELAWKVRSSQVRT